MNICPRLKTLKINQVKYFKPLSVKALIFKEWPLESRIEAAQTKINRLKEVRKAVVVFSCAKDRHGSADWWQLALNKNYPLSTSTDGLGTKNIERDLRSNGNTSSVYDDPKNRVPGRI
jgi:hypothetical protein